MSRLDFISLNVRGYSTLLSLPLVVLNVYKQKGHLAGLLMIKQNETPRIFFEKVKFEVRFD